MQKCYLISKERRNGHIIYDTENRTDLKNIRKKYAKI